MGSSSINTNQIRRNNETAAQEALIAALPRGALLAVDTHHEFNAITKAMVAAAEQIWPNVIFGRQGLFRIHARGMEDAAQLKRDNEKRALKVFENLPSEDDWTPDGCIVIEQPSHNPATKVMIVAKIKLESFQRVTSGGAVDYMVDVRDRIDYLAEH